VLPGCSGNPAVLSALSGAAALGSPFFIPQLIALHLQGHFPYDRLAKFYKLEDINQAAKDSEKGVTVKPIIRMQ